MRPRGPGGPSPPRDPATRPGRPTRPGRCARDGCDNERDPSTGRFCSRECSAYAKRVAAAEAGRGPRPPPFEEFVDALFDRS